MVWDDANPTIYISEVDTLPYIGTINEVLGVLNISNVRYMAKAWDMDVKWLRDTLIMEEWIDQIYWPSTKGIKSTYFIDNARRWLNLVS